MGTNIFTNTREYIDLMYQLRNSTNTPQPIIKNLIRYVDTIVESDLEKKYGEPMSKIGIYIAIASLCCIFAMLGDLAHGIRSRKLWFPVKYFPINAFTLALIAVAMKLPVDLSGSMPGIVDQFAKLGSVAFMCTMMANFLPYLATMGSIELLTTFTALGVLVITLVVNVCIQIRSGVVGGIPDNDKDLKKFLKESGYGSTDTADLIYTIIGIIYVALLLLLLIIHASSSLAILRFKETIEPKYQQCHEAASKDFSSSTGGELLTVDKLQQHVNKHWIMAGSGSPQFISACSVTTTASGVICFVTSLVHALTVLVIGILIVDNIKDNKYIDEQRKNNIEIQQSIILYDSAYDWSTLVIFVVQSIGVLVGTIAPVFRCFASMSFKLSKHIKVFKVENEWTDKLYDWKYGRISLPLLSISLPFGNHKQKLVIRALKNLFLNLCITLQVGVVVVCKIISLIPVLLMSIPILFIMCWRRCLKRGLCCSGGTVVENSAEDREYVLQPLSTRALKRLLKSFSLLIQRSEKKQPENLMKLIEKKSTDGFQGAKMLEKDDHQVQCSPSKVVYPNRWSLPVVTLTTIAITLPNTGEVEVESLLKSVREGLKYVTLVEQTLNAPNGYGSIETAAKKLWEEVDFCHTWLGIGLKDITSEVNATSSQVDTTTQTVQVFLKQAYKILEGSKISDDASKITSICAKSMSRVTETIIGDKESHKELFGELSSKIADIMAECLTNLPQVIEKKCHTDVIEKREASVEDATKLLGETKMIIKTLQDKRSAAYLCEP